MENTDKLTNKATTDAGNTGLPDLSNTEIAFAYKSDAALRKSARLFSLMNKQWLVNLGAKLGLPAIKMRLPFAESIVKNTVYEQFCGGTTLLDSMQTIEKLQEFGVATILDYGAEAKEKEEDFNNTMNENIRAIEFAARTPGVPMISTKVTGMARFELLEAIQRGDVLTPAQRAEYKNVLKRIDSICYVASQKNVGIYIDAEETWIQDSINHLANLMMQRYNREKVIVYNTFQMYRTDQLQYLMNSFKQARKEGYLLGAKLVRGAYMEKERDRAARMGYPSPIHPTKAATDDAFDTGMRFCVDNYEYIASCNASHNANSVMLQAELIAKRGIPRDHPHLWFSQLYGMSDNLTFNLAKSGFNVAKYVPYGPVRDVVPYLIRRAQENTSVTGDMTREHALVVNEMKRRGLV